MLKSKDRIFALIFLILGAVLYFTPDHIAPVCPVMPDGGFMKCHWMGEAVRMLGGLIAALGVVFLLFKSSRIGIAFSNIGLGVCLILLQTVVIGTCKTATMHCNVYTKPVILLLAIILIAIDVGYLFVNRRR